MITKRKIKGLFFDVSHQSISRDQLTELLWSVLKDATLEEFVSFITNRFYECIEYGKLMNGQDVGIRTSLLFNPHRLSTSSINSTKGISIFEGLKDKRVVSGMARVALFKGIENRRGLLTYIEAGVQGVGFIQEFPPYLARDIYKFYGLDSTRKILDPCGGWGGRMIGASVVGSTYEAFEPSTQTYKGLLKLYDFIKGMNPEFSAKIWKLPFEDSRLKSNFYDFALTSPPYYDTEVYSDEETNSLNRYPSFEKWINGFFIPLVEKTMISLKQEGVFVINLGDRVYPLSDVLKENFQDKYRLKRVFFGKYSPSGGFGRDSTKGEKFYEIRKKK